MEKHIAIYESKEIRKAFHNEEWWFAIVDVVSVLTDSANPSDYLKKLRKRDPSLSDTFKGGGQIVPPLSLHFETTGGIQKLLAWNTAGIFRLIQSIPSTRAEPFKRWLAQVGVERMREIEDPAIASAKLAKTLDCSLSDRGAVDRIRRHFTQRLSRAGGAVARWRQRYSL